MRFLLSSTKISVSWLSMRASGNLVIENIWMYEQTFSIDNIIQNPVLRWDKTLGPDGKVVSERQVKNRVATDELMAYHSQLLSAFSRARG